MTFREYKAVVPGTLEIADKKLFPRIYRDEVLMVRRLFWEQEAVRSTGTIPTI